MILEPKFALENPARFLPTTGVKIDEIADADFLATKVAPMDLTSFLGFPTARGTPFFDESWNLPIARHAVIASLPDIPFTHPSIPVKDVDLVSGFSFSGSSGSPILLHQKGLKVGPPLEDPNYVPPRVIGVMSGCFNEPEGEALRHSGLSFFTRSTSLLPLLRP